MQRWRRFAVKLQRNRIVLKADLLLSVSRYTDSEEQFNDHKPTHPERPRASILTAPQSDSLRHLHHQRTVIALRSPVAVPPDLNLHPSSPCNRHKDVVEVIGSLRPAVQMKRRRSHPHHVFVCESHGTLRYLVRILSANSPANKVIAFQPIPVVDGVAIEIPCHDDRSPAKPFRLLAQRFVYLTDITFALAALDALRPHLPSE